MLVLTAKYSLFSTLFLLTLLNIVSMLNYCCFSQTEVLYILISGSY